MGDAFPNVRVRDITFPPGGLTGKRVRVCRDYWCRSVFVGGQRVTTPRHQNWFGVLTPGRLRITVEVNVVPEGINKKVEGFFARDISTGTVYLMHSGNVRGGKRGVGGRAFRAWYGRPRAEVFDSDGNVRFGFVVMPCHGLDPARSARRYVDSITVFRRAVAAGEVDVDDPEFQQRMQDFDDFYSEPRGRRTGYRPGRIDYLSSHGEVVDALHDWRKHQAVDRGSRIVKNVFIDMGVANPRGRLTEIYEVKTSTSRSDVYSAIGQLMVHGPLTC